MTTFNPSALASAIRSLAASTLIQYHHNEKGFTLALDGLNGSHPQAEFQKHAFEAPRSEEFGVSNGKYLLEAVSYARLQLVDGVARDYVMVPAEAIRPILNRCPRIPGIVPDWCWSAEWVGVRVFRLGDDACFTVGDRSAPDPAPESRCPALPEGLWDLDLPNLEVAE